MGLDLAYDRAADDGQYGVSQWPPDRAQRLPPGAGGIQDAVADPDLHRLLLDLVVRHLDGANDAVVDSDSRIGVDQLEARLGGPSRLAVGMQGPAGDEGRVADAELGQITADFHAPACDEHSVEHEATPAGSG